MTVEKTSFTHSDGRTFNYHGASPHVTRDGRNVTLKGWETCCAAPGCDARFVVKTATETPWLWPNFQPAKFCGVHRADARKEGQAKLIKARADGLAKWRSSEEGKAALEQRAKDCMGSIERTMYEAVRDLSLVDEKVMWCDVYRLVIATMEKPKEGKRDTRYQRMSRALWTLREKGRLDYRSEVVTLLR